MARRKKPQPKWRAIVAWIWGRAGMIVGAVGLVSLLISGTAWMAVAYTDNSRSDPPPRASVARVLKLAEQESRDVAAALHAVQQQTAQQAVSNQATAAGFCGLYRPLEADARARAAANAADRTAQIDVLTYTQLRAQWCGQAIAAPP